jgi:hypothetical protein
MHNDTIVTTGVSDAQINLNAKGIYRINKVRDYILKGSNWNEELYLSVV